MPWKVRSKMDERMKFVTRLLDGEKMTDLCHEFGISRKTGYKIWNRYHSVGVEGLTDRSRRPVRFANQLPIQIEKFILNFKRDKPSWGALKIRERLVRMYPNVATPARSTIHEVLDRHGLVKKRKRNRHYKAEGTILLEGLRPNDLWCTDYKGEFMLGNKQYCYPLTITDFKSRYLLTCEALETTKEKYAFRVFEETFKEYGLPNAIRSDNGVPFASPFSLFGLSKLSVWWLRLGIRIEKIMPGHPEQNGRHERMHLTLKKETTKPPGNAILQQQMKFDSFKEEFNTERPHQGINMKFPSELYVKSERLYTGLPDIEYPIHDKTIIVTNCGRICINGKKINFSKVFGGQAVGVTEVDDGIWQVCFMDYDLGYFDEESKNFEPSRDPFGLKSLPMSPV